MVNDVSRRIDAFEAGGHHPYRSSLVPPEVEHAARIGNVGPVQQYLQAGKDPNARSVYQSQLLHVAARHGQTDVLKVLVKAAGIDIMALDYGGMRRTALHWSCQTGDIRSVEVLVDAGANTTVQGKSWAKMVQGRRCGSLLQSNAPPEESPADLCKTNLVRLALLRPPWSPESHKDFPEEFRAVARLLVLAAGGRSQAAEQAQVADEQPAVAPAPSQQWPLSLDLTRTIIAQAAYPFSAWLPDEVAG